METKRESEWKQNPSAATMECMADTEYRGLSVNGNIVFGVHYEATQKFLETQLSRMLPTGVGVDILHLLIVWMRVTKQTFRPTDVGKYMHLFVELGVSGKRS